jgi:hypothetical protein
LVPHLRSRKYMARQAERIKSLEAQLAQAETSVDLEPLVSAVEGTVVALAAIAPHVRLSSSSRCQGRARLRSVP